MRWTRVLRNVLAGGALAASSVVVNPGTADATHNPPAVFVASTPTDIVELGDCGVKSGQWDYGTWIADNQTLNGARGYAQECFGVITALAIVSFRDTNPAVQVRPNSVEVAYDYVVSVAGISGPDCSVHSRRSEVLSTPNATGAFLQFRSFSHRVEACGGTFTFRHNTGFTCLENLSPLHGRCG